MITFPLPFNYDLNVKTGTFTLPNSAKIMPGAVVTIDSGATLTVNSKLAMTPSFKGLIARTFPGVRPSILYASSPTANTFFVSDSTATTLGSFNTIPSPFIYIRILNKGRDYAKSIFHDKLYDAEICR